MSKNNGIVLIHGKEYKTVAKRVEEFRDGYPEYFLITDIIQLDQEQCVVKATIGKNVFGGEAGSILHKEIVATGYAQEFRNASPINKTSYVEVCETSSIGRALANFGLAGSEFASAEEVMNAMYQQKNPVKKEVSDDDVEVIKGQLVLSHEAGELKQAFQKLDPSVQERVRDFANDLRKSA